MVGECVIIDAVTAAPIVQLLADGRRRAAREGWHLADETVAIIRTLEALADHARKSAPPPPEGEPDWLDTTEAASLLAVTPRQVRRLCQVGTLRSRRVRGQVFVDAADALAEADARSRTSRRAA